jgi:hypothetical protein
MRYRFFMRETSFEIIRPILKSPRILFFMQEQNIWKAIVITLEIRLKKNKVDSIFVRSKKLNAEMLTKPLNRVNFEENRARLGLHKRADFEGQLHYLHKVCEML